MNEDNYFYDNYRYEGEFNDILKLTEECNSQLKNQVMHLWLPSNATSELIEFVKRLYGIRE